MADEQTIRVVITGVASDLRRALDGAKGDLGGLKAAIKDVPKSIPIDVKAETTTALARLKELRSLAKDVPKHIEIKADADTGIASAKLRLLKSEARDAEQAIARAQLGGLVGGGGGASSAASAGGGLPGAGPLALAVGAAPLIAGLAGSLTAIVGSAGAAVLGLGAVGTAAAGAAAAGVAPLALLSGGLKDAVTLAGQLDQAQKNLVSARQQYGGQNKQLAAAQANYNAAVAAFGPSSATAVSAHNRLLLAQQKQAAVAPQITSAQNALNKLTLQADPATLAFARSLQKVNDTLDDAEQRIMPAFARTLTPVLSTFTALLPTIEQMARIDLRGVTAWLRPLLDFANSSAFKTAMLDLSRTFAQLGGPLGQAFTNIFHALLNVAVAASPYLVQIAHAFDSWSKSFLASLSPGQHLNDLIKGLVGQLHSWWDLAVALGKIMVTIFSSGAQQGKGLVDSLTQILTKWNAWLNTSAGQAAMHKFFTDSVGLLKAVLTTLAPVAKLIGSMAVGLVPTMTTLLGPIASILATISGWVNDLSHALPPVLNALPGLAVAVGVLAGWKALSGLASSVAESMLTAAKTKLPGAAAGAAGGATAAEGAGAGAAGAGAAGVGLLPIVAGAAVAFVGITALSKAINGDGGVNAALDQMRTKMRDAIAAGDLTKIHAIGLQAASMGHQLKDAGISGSQAFIDLADHAASTASSLQTSFGNMSQRLSEVSGLFKIMAGDAGQSLHTILTQAQSSGAAIASTLGTHSTAARVAIATNFQIAAQDVRASMQAGVINTGQGMKAIHELLAKALKALGGKPLAVSNFLADVGPGVVTAPSLVAAGDLTAGGVNSPHAGGGWIGSPGEKGRDDVPVVLGRGEAVLNHPQQAVVNRALARDGWTGGLNDVFSRVGGLHYMAGGGFAGGRFAQGGYTGYSLPLPRSMMSNPGNWSFDQGVDIPGGAGGEPEFAIGPGVITQEGIGGFGPNAPILRIDSGPLAGRSIYYGHAGPDLVKVGQHVTAGQQISSVGQGIVGISTGPHIEIGFWPPTGGASFAPVLHQLLGGAGVTGVGGAGGVGAVPVIRAPKVTGTGAIAGITRGGIDTATIAANAYLQAHAPAGNIGAGSSGVSSAGLSGGLRAEVHQLSQRFGWSGADENAWLAVIGQEDASGSLTARNASGAYGIAQFIDGPGEYAKYGGDVNTMAGQLLAMANYIKQRYVTPSAAEAFHLAHNYYAGGGFIDQVKTLPAGGGSWVDRMTIGSIDSAGNSGGFNQAGKPYALGTVPRGPVAGPWWAEGDRRATIGTSFGGKPGGQAARFTKGAKSTVAFKVDTGDGNSFGDIYPTANSAIDFTDNGPVKVDFISDAIARALLSGTGSKAKAPSSLVDYSHGRRPGGSLSFTKPKAHATAKPLPKFKALPGFDPSDMNRIGSIENYLSNTLSPWQGLISGEHSRQPVTPLVTLADGSQVVNKDGMIDPVTGQFAKGINARLAEIGHLGGTPDLNTELGIDQKYLDEYVLEAIAAGAASKQFLPWLAKMKADRAKQTGAASDDQAVIDRLTLLKSRLPKERSDRTFAISQRFKLARHKLQTSSSTGKFSATELLHAQLAGISQEELAAKTGIPTTQPVSWKGDAGGWAAQRKSELAGLTSEFSARRQALQSSALAHNFTGQLAKSNALFGLGQEEAAEKHSLADSFTQRSLDFGTQIKSSTAWLGRDKRLIASDETALTAATGTKDGSRVVPGGGSFADQLASMLGPMGTLAVNIAQKQKIDIPNLTDEIAALTGTKLPAAPPSPNLAALLALDAQLLAETQQALAVSRAQFGVFAGFEPLLAGRLMGSFATGIDRVPQTGPYLLHRDEMVVPDPYGPQSNRASVQTGQGPVEVVVVMGNNDVPLMKVIDARMNGKALRVVSDQSGQRSRLLSGVRRP